MASPELSFCVARLMGMSVVEGRSTGISCGHLPPSALACARASDQGRAEYSEHLEPQAQHRDGHGPASTEEWRGSHYVSMPGTARLQGRNGEGGAGAVWGWLHIVIFSALTQWGHPPW